VPESASSGTDLDLDLLPQGDPRRPDAAWGTHSSLVPAAGGGAGPEELRRPPSDSGFRYFLRHIVVAVLCATIRDWTIAHIPNGSTDLDQLICQGKTLRSSIEPTVSAAQVILLR
jgi:hypothetical protein